MPKHQKRRHLMNTVEEIKALKLLCILAFAETRHLKKLLISRGVISQDDIYDYANSLEEYMRELDSKDKLLMKDYPNL
jgi:NurA-like 5'-3' nuclease